MKNLVIGIYLKMNKVTKEIIKELWYRNITNKYVITQRFWEYFITIKMLDLTEDSVLIDIGGGCPTTGKASFAEVVKKYIKQVVVIDENVKQYEDDSIIFIKENASYELLKDLFDTYSPTHVSCISVLEHISNDIRKSIIQSINDNFKGDVIGFTMEFHPIEYFFHYQLTAESMSEFCNLFTNFYLSDMQKTPIHATNAFEDNIPLWYPISLKFNNLGG